MAVQYIDPDARCTSGDHTSDMKVIARLIDGRHFASKNFFVLLFCFTMGWNAGAQSAKDILEISTDKFKDEEFVEQKDSDGNTLYVKYVIREQAVGKPLILTIKGNGVSNDVTIVRSPNSSLDVVVLFKNVTSFTTDEPIEFVLKEKESAEFDVTVKRATDSKVFKYSIRITSEKAIVRNASYIFLSAIRSVAGKAQPKEFFDLNLKFNYLGNMFTLFGLDLSLSSTDSSQLGISEGLLTVNRFLHTPTKLMNSNFNRAAFVGIGLKVFNHQPYVGGHLGSIEICGPLFSSYALIGYYRNAYGRKPGIPLLAEDVVNFENNFYAEFTLAFDNKKEVANILSDIRIKLGGLFPFTYREDTLVKPQWKDNKYRIVLEVPIGGIFKF